MIDLLEGEFDLAIRTNVPADSSLMVRRLADWRLVRLAHRAWEPKFRRTETQYGVWLSIGQIVGR
jgi:DNA-binding transcriptional LysR family regulator